MKTHGTPRGAILSEGKTGLQENARHLNIFKLS